MPWWVHSLLSCFAINEKNFDVIGKVEKKGEQNTNYNVPLPNYHNPWTLMLISIVLFALDFSHIQNCLNVNP
jgi:hypothetical protein